MSSESDFWMTWNIRFKPRRIGMPNQNIACGVQNSDSWTLASASSISNTALCSSSVKTDRSIIIMSTTTQRFISTAHSHPMREAQIATVLSTIIKVITIILTAAAMAIQKSTAHSYLISNFKHSRAITTIGIDSSKCSRNWLKKSDSIQLICSSAWTNRRSVSHYDRSNTRLSPKMRLTENDDMRRHIVNAQFKLFWYSQKWEPRTLRSRVLCCKFVLNAIAHPHNWT